MILVKFYEGDVLNLNKVTRSEMGTYLCTATNGVDPNATKTTTVHVRCKWGMVPNFWPRNQSEIKQVKKIKYLEFFLSRSYAMRSV